VSVWEWLILAVVVAVLGLYLSMTAGRLDRLHRRIDVGALALSAHLAQRQALTVELAGSGLLDPATSVLLADAAHNARAAPPEDPVARSLAESNLTQTLGAVFADAEDVAELTDTPQGAELIADLDSVTRRVELSRRFLNDGVRACRAVRHQWVVRTFGLAGYTPWPETVEMDDAPPRGLGGR